MPNFYLDSIITYYPIILKITVKLETIRHYHTRQKTKNDFFYTFARTEWGGR